MDFCKDLSINELVVYEIRQRKVELTLLKAQRQNLISTLRKVSEVIKIKEERIKELSELPSKTFEAGQKIKGWFKWRKRVCVMVYLDK